MVWIASRLLGWFDCWWFILVVLGLGCIVVVYLQAVRVWLLVVVCFVSGGRATVLFGLFGLVICWFVCGMVVGGCFGVFDSGAVNLLVLLGCWLCLRFCLGCFGLMLGGLGLVVVC